MLLQGSAKAVAELDGVLRAAGIATRRMPVGGGNPNT